MDELNHNLLAAWHRVFELCKVNPVEARRRYRRTLPGTVLDRPSRAWCVAIRALDTRLTAEGVGESRSGARVAYEIVLDGGVIRELGGPGWLLDPGVPMRAAAGLGGQAFDVHELGVRGVGRASRRVLA